MLPAPVGGALNTCEHKRGGGLLVHDIRGDRTPASVSTVSRLGTMFRTWNAAQRSQHVRSIECSRHSP